MNTNVGGVDRGVRIVLGLALFSLYFLLDGSAKYWGLVGVVPLLTAAIGYCPLYSLLGMNTCPTKLSTRH